MAISLRLNTRQPTAVATATRLPPPYQVRGRNDKVGTREPVAQIDPYRRGRYNYVQYQAPKFRFVMNSTALPSDNPQAPGEEFAFAVAAQVAGEMPVSEAVSKAISAGGLVFREADDGIETLLCARTRPGRQGPDAPLSWRLPKGTPEPGESVEETARREVQEETGVHVSLIAPITSIQYYFVGHDDGVRYDKTVHFYLMEPLGGSTADHDAEFDVVEWQAYDRALQLLEYDNERSVLEAARSLIASYRDGE